MLWMVDNWIYHDLPHYIIILPHKFTDLCIYIYVYIYIHTYDICHWFTPLISTLPDMTRYLGHSWTPVHDPPCLGRSLPCLRNCRSLDVRKSQLTVKVVKILNVVNPMSHTVPVTSNEPKNDFFWCNDRHHPNYPRIHPKLHQIPTKILQISTIHIGFFAISPTNR